MNGILFLIYDMSRLTKTFDLVSLQKVCKDSYTNFDVIYRFDEFVCRFDSAWVAGAIKYPSLSINIHHIIKCCSGYLDKSICYRQHCHFTDINIYDMNLITRALLVEMK